MDSATDKAEKVVRHATVPFLVKVFYRFGSFHRAKEFSEQELPHHYLDIYTWPNCTLSELALHVAGANILPEVAVGIRLAFRLVYLDKRPQPPRFLVKDLGSVVLGEGGPGASTDPEREEDDVGGATLTDVVPDSAKTSESAKTLSNNGFMVGDYISCAILEPGLNGEVTSVASAQGSSVMINGQGTTGKASWENQLGRLGARRGQRSAFGAFGGRDEHGSGPSGEWRRGERLPSFNHFRGRGGRGRR